jgi:hypothetical protein
MPCAVATGRKAVSPRRDRSTTQIPVLFSRVAGAGGVEPSIDGMPVSDVEASTIALAARA